MRFVPTVRRHIIKIDISSGDFLTTPKESLCNSAVIRRENVTKYDSGPKLIKEGARCDSRCCKLRDQSC
jgi:hypothetical protein